MVEVTDYVANGSFASLAENVQYKQEEDYAVLIRLVDYNNGFKDGFVYIDEHAYNFLGKSKLFGGEIIISNVGANVGTVFKAPYLKKPMSLAPNAICVKLKGNNDFYYYWFKSRIGQYSIDSLVSGSAQPKFNKTHFKSMPIPVPPIHEQDEIASILSSLDDKIAVNKKICENLEAQAQALFKHWFVDFAPFKDGKFVESELGMIPKGWRVGKLDQVTCNITDGVHNTVKDVANGGFYLLSCKNIKGGIITIGDHERTIDGETFNKLRKRTKLQKGDILLSSVGTIGEMVLLNDDLSNIEFQRSVAIIKPDNDVITSHFLFYSLMNQKVNIIHSAHGAVQQCLFISDIANFSTIIPPKEDIIKFTNVVKVLVDKKTTIEKENKCLATLRDTLLPKLMSGEIKVNEIEKSL